MQALKLTVSGAVLLGALALMAVDRTPPAQARIAPEEVTQEEAQRSLFNGVWAPEHRMPRGPSPEGGPPRGPRGDRPPPGAGFGPPPGGPGFGPPGMRGRPQISVEDAAKGLDAGDIRTREMMTDEGRAMFATYDPMLHPSSNCRTPGLPSIAMIPELQEWSVTPDAITIHHESDAVRRIVHLDTTAHPAEAHSVLGHAFGAVSGHTLTIETANLAAGWGGLGRNAPGSDARVVRETYRLIGYDTIEGEIMVEDAKFLRQPLRLRVTLKRQPAGVQIEDFPCDVEVAQRDYRYIRAGAEAQQR